MCYISIYLKQSVLEMLSLTFITLYNIKCTKTFCRFESLIYFVFGILVSYVTILELKKGHSAILKDGYIGIAPIQNCTHRVEYFF